MLAVRKSALTLAVACALGGAVPALVFSQGDAASAAQPPGGTAAQPAGSTAQPHGDTAHPSSAPGTPPSTQIVQSGVAPKRGAQWQNGTNTYAVIPDARAIRLETKYESPASAFQRMGVTTGSVLDRKAGYLIYRETAGAKSPSGAGAPLLARKSDPRPVAQNLRTGRYAVVLNALRVELKDATQAEALASDSGLTLGRLFPNKTRAFYIVPAGVDLITLLGRLRGDARVAHADIELVEFTRGTN